MLAYCLAQAFMQMIRERVRLCISHRVVRAQAYRAVPGVLPHFRLLGLCTAGRDEGSFLFETTSLLEQIAFYLQVLREVFQLGYQAHRLWVTLTDLDRIGGNKPSSSRCSGS